MKRPLSIVLVAIVALSLSVTLLHTSSERFDTMGDFFQGMTGLYIADSAVLIESVEDLYDIRHDLDEDYYLGSDLDFCDEESYDKPDEYPGVEEFCYERGASQGWEPLASPGKPFRGFFNAQGYEINNLYMDRPQENYVGLFGYIDSENYVSNLDLVNVDITGGESTGAVVGHIDNGKLYRCYVTGEIDGSSQVGGLSGFFGSESELVLSSSKADVEGSDRRVGGLVGFLGRDSSVLDSYFSGSVSGVEGVGGIVGSTEDLYSNVQRTHSIGSVTGEDGVGGLVGINKQGTVKDSVSSYEETGQYESIGLNEGTEENLYSLSNDEMRDYHLFRDLEWDIERVIDEDKDMNDGFPYLYWELNGDTVSHWSIYDPDLTLSIPERLGGDVLEPGEGEFDLGPKDKVNLVAEAREDHYFDGWKGEVQAVKDTASPETEVVMYDDYEIYPVFSEYLEIILSSTEGGEILEPGEGEFQYRSGEEVDLVAESDDGYEFVGWEGDIYTEEKATSIFLEESKEILASFSGKSEFELDIDKPEEGEKYGEGQRVVVEYYLKNVGNLPGSEDIEFTVEDNDGDTVFEDVEEDKEVDGGEAYQGSFDWTPRSGSSADSPFLLTIEVEEEREEVLVEVVDDFDLILSVFGRGSTDPVEGLHTYDVGETVTVNATAGEDYTFSHWTGDYPLGSQELSVIDLVMDEDKELIAYFENVDPSYEHTLDINVIEEGDTYPSEGSHVHYHGEMVPVRAMEPRGYDFIGWDGDILPHYHSRDKEITVLMDGDREVDAYFEEHKENFTLSIDTDGEGSTEPETGSHIYEEGTNVTLNAVPEEGWNFTEWSGDIESNESETEVTVDSDKDAVAVFTEYITHELDLEVIGKGNVSRYPDEEEYVNGTEVTLNATPEEGWEFSEWSGDFDSNQSSDNVTMDNDKSIIGIFSEKPPFDLHLNISGEGDVITYPDKDEYDDGEEVNLTAVPDDGWVFDSWAGDYRSTEANVTVTFNETKALNATFVEDDSPVIDVEESVDAELSYPDSVETSFSLANEGYGDANLEFSVEDVDDMVTLDVTEAGLAVDETKDFDLVVETDDATDTGEYTGSVLVNVSELDQDVEVPVNITVVEPEVDEMDILGLSLSLDSTTYKEGDEVHYTAEVGNMEDEPVNVVVQGAVYDAGGSLVDDFYEELTVEDFETVSSYFDDLPPGDYRLEVTVEADDELYSSTQEDASFMVQEEDTSLLIWVGIFVVFVLIVAVAAYLLLGDNLNFTASGSGDVPEYIENWIEKYLEEGYSRREIKEMMKNTSENPDLVDVYLDGSQGGLNLSGVVDSVKNIFS